MELEELKAYNKLVIDSAKEVAQPWKWATITLAVLLGLMVALYFLCPANVDVEQNNLNSKETINYKG